MLTIILAGGSSRRMGTDKAMLPLNGKTFLQELIDRYSQLGPVAVSVNEPGRFPFTGAIELPDMYPDSGPLNGIVSAFEHTDAEKIFLTATDLLFGDVELARLLESEIGQCDACMLRRTGGKLEPLFAVYNRSCCEIVRRSLSEGQFSFKRLFQLLKIREIPQESIPQFPIDEILTNINTPQELNNSLQKLTAMKSSCSAAYK